MVAVSPRRARAVAALLCTVDAAAGHVAMLDPPSWSDAGGKGWQKDWQYTLGNEPQVPLSVAPGSTNIVAWFSNSTYVKAPTLNDPSLRTWQNATQEVLEAMRHFVPPHAPGGLGLRSFAPLLISGGYLNKPLPKEGTVDLTRRMPWRAPGSAPVQSPCGVAGGNGRGFQALVGEIGTEYARVVEEDGGLMQKTEDGGYGWGPDARVYRFRDVVETEWQRGSVVEATWGIWANHGGGYQYRLCKLPAAGRAGLAESCFRPLEFVGDIQWAQWGANKSTRVAFAANRTRSGTAPRGSSWTKNPVPVCTDPSGGELSSSCPGCSPPWGFQFEPPAAGVFGYGICVRPIERMGYTMPFSVVDRLQVPHDLTAGKYVLSFRYDAEQTPQVWNSCADIVIV